MRTSVLHDEGDEVGLLPAATLVIWAGCIAVGAMGLEIAYPRPRPATKALPPVVARLIHMELSAVAPSPKEAVAPKTPMASLPPPPAIAPPLAVNAAPPLQAVAQPSPAIAFAVPVAGPSRMVADAERAVPNHQETPATQSAVTPIAKTQADALPVRLTYGEGEGRQPKPDYPREAIEAHQQGAVLVRFVVGTDGRVDSAEVASASPFALLNQAAVRTIREDWRFAPGPVRTFEISIDFNLRHRSL